MNDLKFAFRQLLKSPGFTAVAVLTLALGIGANTAMFSLLNALILRPLPYTHSNELVRLWRTTNRTQRGGFSPADFLDLRRTEGDAGRFAAFLKTNVALSEPGDPAETETLMGVSSDFFDLLDVKPERGRSFQSEEEFYGNHRVVLISHDYWESRFGGADDVVGRIVRIDAEPHEIIGVLPDWATARRPLTGIGLFRPLGLKDADRASRKSILLNIIGRRDPDVSITQFKAFVGAFGNRLANDFPEANADTGWRAESLVSSGMNPTGRLIVFMLIGLSTSVLLIACSNLANFLMARAISRTREFTVRASLGASRLHLIQPLAWESILIAATGGLFALLVSNWMTHWITAESGRYGSRALQLPFDWRVLGFALMAALLTALFFGIVPGLFALRVDLNDTLKSSSRGATASRGHRRLRGLLIIGQFALAMVILSSAGFFLQGARSLIQRDYGWKTDYVAQGAFELPKDKFPSREAILAFQRRLGERLASLPGVDAVSFSYGLPFIALPGRHGFVAEGEDAPLEGEETIAEYNGISPDYFKVTGTRLLSGRAFNESDTADAPGVAIISESFARTLFPGENPIGHRLARAGSETPEWREIVGVVDDVRSTQTTQAPTRFQVYHPVAQEPWHFSRFAVHTTGVTPGSLLDPIRRTFAAIDPDLPLIELMTADEQFERSISDLSMVNKLLGGFALLALALAALGIYGVIARTVAQRTGEFGIRMALGAQIGNIVRLVLASGVRLAFIGAAIGLLGAFGLSRLLAAGLPGLRTGSATVIAGATALLIFIALAACWFPARKASCISPTEALRTE